MRCDGLGPIKGRNVGYAAGKAVSFGAGYGGGVQGVDALNLVPSTCTIAARFQIQDLAASAGVLHVCIFTPSIAALFEQLEGNRQLGMDLLKEQLEQLRNENAALAPDVKAARAAWLSNTDPQQEPKLEKVYQDLSEKDKQLNSRRAELEAKLPSAGERSPLKQGAYIPPRLVSRIANHRGYCSLRLEHNTYTVDQEFLLDAGASLELLLLEDIAQQLHLVQTGCYIEIVGAGGTVRALECQDIKVIAELRDKHTKEVKLTVEKYLTPHVIVDAAPTPDTGPQHAAEYKEEDNSNVVPMNIAATLELRKEKASSVSAPPAVIAAGFDTPLLRRPGLLRLGLEVSLDKNDLYPTRLSFALVPTSLVV
ncbi:hypothetical protein WJX75_005039 [Coccomyxa subellipsoidea]|uniref:Peptidase A2 domain-containing protein n=1 Tax=Coccomyxa subellipsoidea TaxID=248742 RepID=A0ABR2YPG5_9CHLO